MYTCLPGGKDSRCRYSRPGICHSYEAGCHMPGRYMPGISPEHKLELSEDAIRRSSTVDTFEGTDALSSAYIRLPAASRDAARPRDWVNPSCCCYYHLESTWRESFHWSLRLAGWPGAGPGPGRQQARTTSPGQPEQAFRNSKSRLDSGI